MEAVFGALHLLDPTNLAQAAVTSSAKEKQRETYDDSDNDDGSSKPRKIAIVLLRNDLRVHDNAALYYAQHKHEETTHILPVYVFDERQIECSGLPGYQRKGPEARTRLCKFWRTGVFRARLVTEAVFDLRHRLKDRGSNLLVRYGFPEVVIENIVKVLQARGDEITGIHIQKEICAEEVAVERQLRKRLAKLNIDTIHMYDLKHMIAKEDVPFEIGETPDVFTPFRKKVESLGDKMVRPLLEMPDKFLPFPHSPEDPLKDDENYGTSLENEGLETVLAYFFKPLSGSYEIKYADPKAAKHASSAFPWSGGETSALERLEWYFITGNPPPVAHYKETRNMLVGHAYSTKMSPFLCIGCISPRMIYKALDDHEKKYGSSQNTYWVRFEMLWRDYFIYISEKYGSQLFQIEGFEKSTDPKAAEAKKDDWNNWDPDNYLIKAWCRGRTGIPFIDANIIELRETGFMSNRGRQNVASFLTKDLYFDWRIGAEFFESHLVDYEPTANWGNWQYVAGVGNDPRASRQFNPIKQARDYDPSGIYVRTWISQLKSVPNSKVHTPWLMSDEEWKKYMPTADQVAEQTAGPSSARPTYLLAQHRKQQNNGHAEPSESSSSGKASTVGSSGGSIRASSNGSTYDSGSTTSTTNSDEDNSPGASKEPLEAPFFAPEGSKKTSAFKQSLSINETGHEHPDVPVYSYKPEDDKPNQATFEMSRHAQNIREQDLEAHKEHPVRTFDQSATQLTKNMDVLNDYLSGTPYPRKPLFEQQSWKAHYYRNDYGRRANGAGGGNSRRLIRAPKGVPELVSQAAD